MGTRPPERKREQLRQTFDRASELYQRSRPEYPAELIDHLLETVYDAQGYIDLLNTFSGHISMEGWKRDRLYSEIRRRLAERPDGRLRRHWGAVLHIAQRVGDDRHPGRRH